MKSSKKVHFVKMCCQKLLTNTFDKCIMYFSQQQDINAAFLAAGCGPAFFM